MHFACGMAAKVLFTVSEDEILVDRVVKFPCLFDLACGTYKNQVIKDNAWKGVAEAVARSGKKTNFKRLFFNLTIFSKCLRN